MSGIKKYFGKGKISFKCLWIFALAVQFLGCSAKIQPIKSSKAQLEYKTQVYQDLVSLPPPKEPVILVVYKFRDQTGQYKPGLGTTGWSTAVTQGATSMLVKALQDAGAGKWFTILERESLPNLLNERKIIRQTRKKYNGGEGKNGHSALPPLLFAPILLEGGIIAYESNLLTGGLGARYLGIGGSTQYSRDTVTIYLRAVSVKNGRIIKSINTSKTIFSFSLDGAAFKFIGFQELLEAEAGFTTNEPPQMAVLEAIEKAVYGMVIEGVIDGHWSFKNPVQGQKYVDKYIKEKYSSVVANFDENGRLESFSSEDEEEPTPERLPEETASEDPPEVLTGSVDGTVIMVKGDAKKAVSNAQLQLVDPVGRVVQEQKSIYGGYYLFAGVPLGNYTLRVSPEQIQRLNLKSPPEQVITITSNKPVLKGKDITLEPMTRVEHVSRATVQPKEKKTYIHEEKRVSHTKTSFDPNLTLASPERYRQIATSWGSYLKRPGIR